MTASARKGAALAMALFALVTMAMIADAVLAPALASRRAAWRLAAHHAAEAEVERAIGSIAGVWTAAAWRALPVNRDSVTVQEVPVRGIPAAAVTVESRVRRLSSEVFLVAASARAPIPDAPAAALRSILVELVRDTIRVPAAVTAGGEIRLGEGTALAVTDGCALRGETSPPTLLADPASAVSRGGTASDEGSRDTTARAAATYAMPAGIRLTALLAAGSIRLDHGTEITPAPRESGGECIDDDTNWGAHDSMPCATRTPVVVAEGDLLVRGGVGQGALVVAGRLVIEGPFQYRGLIVASGGIVSRGGPVRIDGAVFTSPLASATLHDGATIVGSACAVTGAADATARIAVVPIRGWWR